MRKRLYVLEYFYWNSFLENVIILAYYFIYCLLCKFFDRKIVCRMGEIFMMSKEQFLVIFYGKYILVFGILLWLCIYYCRKGFFRFSFEGMIECKLKKLLEQKKHFLEILFRQVKILSSLVDFIEYLISRHWAITSKTSESVDFGYSSLSRVSSS